MGYKVLGLKVSNLRNIDLVEVDLKGRNFVELTGANASGKSTMLDALFTAILGTKHFGRGFDGWRVVQEGKDKALIKATIGNSERTIEVRRSITKNVSESGEVSTGGNLAITDSEGNKLGQEFLDRLLSEFTVDPVAFTRKSPKDQVEMLKRLGGIDTDGFDALRKKAEEERLIANREVARLKALVAVPADKVEHADVDELYRQREAVFKKNLERTQLVNHVEGTKLAMTRFDERRRALQTDIILAKDRIRAMEEEIASIDRSLEEGAATVALEIPPEESTAAIDAMIAAAQDINRKHEAFLAYEANLKAYNEAVAQAKHFDDEIKRIAENRKAAIASSKLPFKNITFDDDAGVLVDGIPFNQRSTAEQLRMSARIGMEMDPELRVICIRDGSFLDEDSYAIVKELADRHDYQILVETVGEKAGDDQIVLRAGHVISEFEHQETTGSVVKKMDDRL